MNYIMKPLFLLFIAYLSISVSYAAKPREILELARYTDIKLSPDGKRIAAKHQGKDGRIRLFIRDIDKNKTAIVAPRDVTQGDWGEKNVNDYEWVNNEYLVIIGDWSETAKSLHYVKAIGLKSGDPVPVLSDKGINSIVDPIHENSLFIIARNTSTTRYDACSVIQYDINNRSKSETIYTTESKTFEVLTDKQHNIRMVKKEANEDADFTWFAHSAESDSWTQLSLNPWLPILDFDYNPDLIIVAGAFYQMPAGVYFYSLSKDKVAQKLLIDKTMPLDKIATPLYNNATKRLAGAHIDGIKHSTKWIDQSLASIQKNINTACADSNNRIIAWNNELSRIIVERLYEYKPSTYYAFDLKNGVMDYLFTNGGDLEKYDFPKTEKVEIPNRSKLTMTGFLTKPTKSKTPPPLVLIVRNAPFSTFDKIGWKPDDQFYASLGYSVLRLNFRGSGGIKGDLELDWKKADAVQQPLNDIEDALKWVKTNGHANTDRVAIIGSGAGGSLATYASISMPKAFKCVVSNDGIYNFIEYQNKDAKSPISGTAKHFFAEADNGLSQEKLKEYSPMLNAEKITVPLLLAYGQYNNEGYVSHVKVFWKAAKESGVPIEKLHSGNWWGGNISGNESFYEYNIKIADFLKKNL